MFKVAAATCLTLLMAAPAGAVDLTAMCQGWIGKWHEVDDSSRARDGVWEPDLSKRDWEVKSTGPTTCRFFKTGDDYDFDVDLSKGTYDVFSGRNLKNQSIERHEIVSSAIEAPRSWTVTVQVPRRSETSAYRRLVMTMAGDLFGVTVLSATAAAGPYFPRDLTVHRRVAPTP